ncbi:MAG: alpha/beta hydrolase, partial [Candidatus Magasanikbacteria bacterium]|nr:alpha/beta hydrolase [Candidatus Magasanikbacteria bacterium]
KLDSFLDTPFDFETIRSNCQAFSIIHGDNDPLVPLQNAQILSEKLDAPLRIIQNGGHLNGSSGWHALPECLVQLNSMM